MDTLEPDKPIRTATRTTVDPRSAINGIVGKELVAQAEQFSKTLVKRRILEEGVELDRAKLRFKTFAAELENNFDNAEDHLALPGQTQEALDKKFEAMSGGLPSSVRHDFAMYAKDQGLSTFGKSRTASTKIGGERFLGNLEERKNLISNAITRGADDKELFKELAIFNNSVGDGKDLGALTPEAAEKEKRGMIETVQNARLSRDFNSALKSDEGGIDKNGDGIIKMPVRNFEKVIASEEYAGASVSAIQSVKDQILSAYVQEEEARDKAHDVALDNMQALNKGNILARMPGSNITDGKSPTSLTEIYQLAEKQEIDPQDVPGLVEKYNTALAKADGDVKDEADDRETRNYEDTLDFINLGDQEPEIYMEALKLNQEKYKADDFAKLQDEVQKRIDKKEKDAKDGKALMTTNVTKARKAAREQMTPVWGDKSMFSNFGDQKELKNDARRNLGAAIAEEAVRAGKDPELAVSRYIRESLVGDIKPDILKTAGKVENYMTNGKGSKPTQRELAEYLLYLKMQNEWSSKSTTGGTEGGTGTTKDLSKTVEESQDSGFNKIMKMLQGGK